MRHADATQMPLLRDHNLAVAGSPRSAFSASVDAAADFNADGRTAVPKRNSELRIKVFAASISLLLISVALWSCFERRGSPMDEGSLLLYPELMTHGAVPYRDFETFYGPANPMCLAAVYSVFGTTITVERAAGLLYRLLILLAIFCITQRRGTTAAAACTFLSGCMLVVTGLVASAWIGAMACALWYVWIVTTPDLSLRRSCAGGFIAGLALLFRVDLAPAIILASAPLCFVLSWRQRSMLALGAALALLPLGFLTLLAGPEQVANNLFIFPVLRSNPGRHLPLSAVEPYLIHLFALHVAASVVNVIAGLLIARRRWRASHHLALLMASLLAVGVTHQALQRLDLVHLAGVAVLSLGILPVSLAVVGRWRSRVGSSPIFALAATVATAVTLGVVAPDLRQTVGDTFVAGLQTKPSDTALIEKGGRSFVIGTQQTALTIERMLDRLDRLSTQGQRLFVGPSDLRTANYCDTFIYHLMPKLRPATYFLEMNPLSANRPSSRLADDVGSADWLVLNSLWNVSDEQNRSAEYGSDLANVRVRENFESVGRYGTYTLLRRKTDAKQNG